jgi:hypothetical protein
MCPDRYRPWNSLTTVTAWLARHVDSAVTLAAYRREAGRRLRWAVLQLGKPLSSLTHEDLLTYERFLADPQPAARWVLAGKTLACGAPDCRPFAGPIARLVDAGYLADNSLAASRVSRAISATGCGGRRTKTPSTPCRVRLTERERLHAARCRGLLTVLYSVACGATEVASTRVGRFFAGVTGMAWSAGG